MMKRSDDADDGMLSLWRKTWWRSVGFWLGLCGLVFLVWAWVNSYSNLSVLVFPRVVERPGYGQVQLSKDVALTEGVVIPGFSRIYDPPAGLRFSPSKPYVRYRKGNYGFSETEWWGTVDVVNEARRQSAGMAVEVVQCWFPFGFVVLGYVVVWVGSLMMWRRWLRRRRMKVEEVVS